MNQNHDTGSVDNNPDQLGLGAYADPPDWEAECRGLGYMILTIANRYEQARELGDNELLSSAIRLAKDYCDGPLRAVLGPQSGRADEISRREELQRTRGGGVIEGSGVALEPRELPTAPRSQSGRGQ
jgi:hypothetical protein